MSLPVLHPDSHHGARTRHALAFVHLITSCYRLDVASHGAFAEIIAPSMEKENLK